MWIELQLSPPFFIQCCINKIYTVLITDYVRIWKVCYTEEEFLDYIKESNYGLELNRSELVGNGIKMLQKPQELKKLDIQHNGTALIVSMSISFGYSFKLKMNLTEGSSELFFQQVVQPALKTIHDLKSSENELRLLLKKKDEEIGDYIQSLGSKIKYTSLPLYNDELHMKKHTTYSKIYGEKDIPNTLMERVVHVPEMNNIKKESDTKRPIKKEKQSQEIIQNIPTTSRLMQIKKEEQQPTTQKRRKKLNI